jgi:hypothetical protein
MWWKRLTISQARARSSSAARPESVAQPTLAFAEAGANVYVGGLGKGQGDSLVKEVKAKVPKVSIEFEELDVRKD